MASDALALQIFETVAYWTRSALAIFLVVKIIQMIRGFGGGTGAPGGAAPAGGAAAAPAGGGAPGPVGAGGARPGAPAPVQNLRGRMNP